MIDRLIIAACILAVILVALIEIRWLNRDDLFRGRWWNPFDWR